MKRTILVILLFLFVLNMFGQEITDQDKTKEFYLQKSRNQSTAAWVLLGTGTALAVVGFLAFDASWDSASYTTTDIFGFVTLTGIIADLVSIPFFISSGQNRRKAASISIGYQKLYLEQENISYLNSAPSLTVKIDF